MHEWALAEGVVETALRVAQRDGLKGVRTIHVRMGTLQQIDRDIFRDAVGTFQAEASEIVRNADVKIESEPLSCECRLCAETWSVNDEQLAALGEEASEAIHFVPELSHAYLKCPACGSSDFSVERGRGVWIASVEGDTDES
jgi:hydrogenase nickel incorporation protein HypA/HybF